MESICDQCGASTNLPDVFITKRLSFRRRKKTQCPDCHQKAQISGEFKNLLWIPANLIFGLLLVDLFENAAAGWLLLNLALFQVSLLLTIFPHEMCHALAARWMGYRVFRILIGYGKSLYSGKLFGFRFDLNSVPCGGMVIACPVDGGNFRLKSFLFAASGPFANLLLCVLVIPFIGAENYWNWGEFTTGPVPAKAFLLANLFVLLVNLWPMKVPTPFGDMDSDGRRILEAIFTNNIVRKREILATRYIVEAAEAAEAKKAVLAMEWVNQGLEKFPEEFHLLNWKAVLMLDKDPEKARESFLHLHEQLKDSDPPLQKCFIYNNIAYANYRLDRADLLDEADRYSEQAISLIGWLAPIRSTRGSILTELGRIEEALPLLQSAMNSSETSDGKVSSAGSLCIAEAKRGNIELSRQYYQFVENHDSDHFMLKRCRRELAKAEAKREPAGGEQEQRAITSM
ncbi:MAG: site-2 protease family protein [Verrucomicrobiales bacterium]|nr:site-2 protease family protein [Verrucomicrobiales bacterium]